MLSYIYDSTTTIVVVNSKSTFMTAKAVKSVEQERSILMVVLRHGESLVNAARLTGSELDVIQASAGSKDAYGLNPTGYNQARIAATEVQRLLGSLSAKIMTSFSSTSPRATETNQTVLDVLQVGHLPIRQLRSLREIWRSNIQEGVPRRLVEGVDDERDRYKLAIEERMQREGADFRYVTDKNNVSESIGELGNRFASGLYLAGLLGIEQAATWTAPEGEQPAVLVTTHAGALQEGLPILIGTPAGGKARYKFGNAEGVVLRLYPDRPPETQFEEVAFVRLPKPARS